MIKIIKVFILLIVLLANSCQSYDKDISYDELLNLQSTHKIKKSNLEKSLHEVLNDTTNYSNYDFTILIIVSNKTQTKNEVCISKTDYNIFKGNRPDGFNKLVGYFNFEGIPVLLFGDTNNSIIKLENVNFYNVLGKMPEYGRDNPPIIFEPLMKCYEEKL